MSLKNFQDQLEQIVRRLPPQSIDSEIERLKKLIILGGDSVEGVREIAINEDIDESTRVFACWILGRLDEPENSVTLIKLLDSQNTMIRITAIQSLSNYQNAEVLTALRKCLNDIDVEVRKISAQSLGWLNNETSISVLIERLLDEGEDPSVRGVIAEVLGNTNNQKAIMPLIEVLSDTSAEVRFWASYALGELRDVRAIPALRELVSDENLIPGYGSVGEKAQNSIIAIQSHPR